MNKIGLKSLSAKLFFYMSALVLLTIIGISFQFRKSFMDSQYKQVEDLVQSQAERIGAQVESTLEALRSQMAVNIPNLYSSDKSVLNFNVQKYIDSNPDYISINLFLASNAEKQTIRSIGSAFTKKTMDPRFEGKFDEKIKETITESSHNKVIDLIKKNHPEKFSAESIGHETHLPIAILIMKFDATDRKTSVWATLSIWQTQFTKSLVKSKFVNSYIINASRQLFSSLSMEEIIQQNDFSSDFLVNESLKSNSPSGIVSLFTNKENKRRIGGFARIPKFEMTILVDQDLEFAYQTLNSALFKMSLWAALFMMVAILFALIGSTSITRGLRAVANLTTRIASGDFKSRIVVKTKDEVGILAESVNNLSGQIQSLMTSQIEKARFEKELETARIVQSTFFPKENRSRDHFVINGFYQPASECGGDLWGHFSIQENLEFVFIADAMGHGAPAALVTAMAYSATMTIASVMKEHMNLMTSPSEILNRLNHIIWEAVRGSISITFFASIIDLNCGTITYANAGHNFPILLPLNPKDPRIKNAKQISKNSPYCPISLKLMGSPLGVDQDSKYRDQSIELAPGDKIFFFTDGLIECESKEGNALGRKWLLERIANLGEASGEELMRSVIENAFKFFGTHPIKDDVTVVTIEIGKGWLPKEKNTAQDTTAFLDKVSHSLEQKPPPTRDSENILGPTLHHENNAFPGTRASKDKPDYSQNLASGIRFKGRSSA